jgi:L-Ala-D/L-Glu epimerase
MKIIGATIYGLQIPFVENFSHSAKARTFSDSIVVRVVAEDGTVGYGEGLARHYITGETASRSIEHMRMYLWPAISKANYPDTLTTGEDPIATLSPIASTIPYLQTPGVIAWNVARASFEIAIIDCLLKRQKLSLSDILPPKVSEVTYSGFASTGSIDRVLKHARYFKKIGLSQLKIKIGAQDDVERVAAIREAVGNEISLRADANGAFELRNAINRIKLLAKFNLEVVEQPIPRRSVAELVKLKEMSPLPIMVDESLVTPADAQALIAANACDFVDLRVSKCGGIVRTLEIAKKAAEAGIRIQLGCHIGETAILSAAGRHVAGYIDNVAYVEGSYGNILLSEDVSAETICFDKGGKAPILREAGLGIQVREDVLRKYAYTIIPLGKELR